MPTRFQGARSYSDRPQQHHFPTSLCTDDAIFQTWCGQVNTVSFTQPGLGDNTYQVCRLLVAEVSFIVYRPGINKHHHKRRRKTSMVTNEYVGGQKGRGKKRLYIFLLPPLLFRPSPLPPLLRCNLHPCATSMIQWPPHLFPLKHIAALPVIPPIIAHNTIPPPPPYVASKGPFLFLHITHASN